MQARTPEASVRVSARARASASWGFGSRASVTGLDALVTTRDVLVKRLPADPVGSRELGFWQATLRQLYDFVHLVRGKRLLAALVHALCLGDCNAFPLALTDQLALEFAEGGKERQH